MRRRLRTMAHALRRSLSWRLIWRLIALYVASLVIAVIGLLIFAWSAGYLNGVETNEDSLKTLQAAIVRQEDGTLAVRPTADYRTLAADAPGLWYVIRDSRGQELSYGDVPVVLRSLLVSDRIGRIDLQRGAHSPYPGAFMQTVESVAGEVRILTGGGVFVAGPRLFLMAALWFRWITIPIFLLLSLTTAIFLPRLIRQALAGVGDAASHAQRIDFAQPGTRLPTATVPDEIQPLVAAFNSALQRLDEGYERHRRFMADAAHELRTPIAILQTRLEGLPEGQGKDRALEDVARLGTLAGQLLDLQRLGQEPHSFMPLDIVGLCQRVTGELAPLAISSGYEISFSTDVGQVSILGDEMSLERAVTNLVHNAICHGGYGGTIMVVVDAVGAIEVRDDGEGIPPEERERVFQPFYRLHARRAGAGLGLNLVKEVVVLHRGRIRITESESGGTCVRMELSLATPRPEQGSRPAPMAQPAKA